MKPIPGLGNYYVTACGSVVNWTTRRHKTPQIDRDGYVRFNCSVNGKNRAYLAHRLVASAHYGKIEKGLVVNHLNFCKKFNFISNLEICTNKQNYDHARKGGRYDSLYGSKLSQLGKTNYALRSLTLEQAIEIRLLKDKFLIKKIAEIYSVNADVVSRILRNRTYKNG